MQKYTFPSLCAHNRAGITGGDHAQTLARRRARGHSVRARHCVGARPELSEPPDPHHRALRRRLRAGRDRPHRCGGALPAPRAAGRRRQPPGRRRQDRHRDRRARGRRRLHAAARLEGHPRRHAAPVSGLGRRPGEGLRADLAPHPHPERDRGQSRGQGERHERADRAGQDGEPQLRHARRGHQSPPARRDAPADLRAEAHARAVQELRRDPPVRRARRREPRRSRRPAGHGLRARRAPEGARCDRHGTFALSARRARPSRSAACPGSSTAAGSRSSRRPARRRTPCGA